MYVDDILIFDTSLVIMEVSNDFCLPSMKDMAEVNMILRVKIMKGEDCIVLSQDYYEERLFHKFEFFDVTPVITPCDANSQLKKNNCDTVAQIIRSLNI